MVRQAGTTSSSRFTHKKRKSEQKEPIQHLIALFETLFWSGSGAHASVTSLQTSQTVFDLNNAAEKQRLVLTMWSPDLHQLLRNAMTTANPELCDWLNSQAVDSTDRTRHRALRNEEFWGRWEGVLSLLVRSHNMKSVPLITAVLSVAFWHHQMPIDIWQSLTTLFRVVLSKSWVKGVLPLAYELNPGPRYPVAAGFSIACFDNFTIRAAGGLMTDETVGERLDMTNWASLAVPAAAVDPNLVLSINSIVTRGGLFKSSIDQEGFVDLFSPLHPDLQAFRSSRWLLYMQAAKNKKLDEKPSPAVDLPPTHIHMHVPIWDRLQSSYDDVNAELDTIRRNEMHCSSSVIFVGCDGAGYSRLIHRLAQNPQLYFDTTPAIIPQLGEHPHANLSHPALRLAPMVAADRAVRACRAEHASPSRPDRELVQPA